LSRFIVKKRQANLLQIILALGAASRFPRGLHRWKKQGHQHADNGDHDQ
jgi:hypothetical protein